MEELIKEAGRIRQAIKDYLMAHLSELELVNVDTHYVVFSLGNYIAKIWTANGVDCAKFYEDFAGIQVGDADYSEEEIKLLWSKAQEEICEHGQKRAITRTQMSNDLYFKFQGVNKEVKFTGYDDSDWWTKYKPSEIEEDEGIVWMIDWDKNVAIYKPKTPKADKGGEKKVGMTIHTLKSSPSSLPIRK